MSEDRKSEGLALGLSIADNLTLTRLDPFGPLGLVLPAQQQAAAARWIERMGIRCGGPSQPAGELSGGNQQKVAMARLLHHDVDIFILDEPTRGIDVGSKAQIYRLVDALVADTATGRPPQGRADGQQLSAGTAGTVRPHRRHAAADGFGRAAQRRRPDRTRSDDAGHRRRTAA